MASNSIVRAQVRKRSSTPALCPHHPGNKAVFVCSLPRCNGSFACMKCVTSNHKGHEMEDLADYAVSKKQIIKNKIKSGKEGVLTLLLQNIKSTEQIIAENKTQTKDDQNKIIQRCNDIKAELDKICLKYTELRKKTGDENDQKLTKHKECLETLYAQYKAELEECETAVQEGSDSDIVLADKEFPTSPKPPNLPKIESVYFRSRTISNRQLEEGFGELLSVKDIGVTMTTTVPPVEQGATALPVYNFQQVAQFALKTNTSNPCDYLYPMSLDQLYVWFNKSRTISLVNKHGKVTNTITLQPKLEKSDLYSIDDVCLSSKDGTLWSVCNYAGTVQQVDKAGTPLQSFKLKNVWSVCVTSNQSVLLGDGGNHDVRVFSTSGEYTRALSIQRQGLRPCAYCTTECQKTGRVAMTDYAAVLVLDKNFRYLFTLYGKTVITYDKGTKSTGYNPKKEFRPIKMCFDKDGDLLVSDRNNNSLIQFSSSGQYISTVIQETDDKKCPHAINIAPDGTLWVGHDNDLFRQIKYK